MANAVPNSFKVMLWKGQIEGLTDVFKIILMQPGFVFDQDSHHDYADVIADELPTGNGYIAGGATLAGISIDVNNVSDRVEVTFNNAQWDATGGSLQASGAIIYNDSTLTSGGDDYTDAIVSYKDAGGDLLAVVGTPIIISSIMETIEDKI